MQVKISDIYCPYVNVLLGWKWRSKAMVIEYKVA
jgi:hypothetical protein